MTEANPMYAAIKAQQGEENDGNKGVVTSKNDRVRVTYTDSVGLSAEDLIRDHGFLISPSSATSENVVLFKSR
ncbi:hypothetical protein M1M34_gp085 [Haloarcula tailed virus 2]|uniref:Uncharacterized protein n=1 Tax=Haloarcula tailed virus 2 TaxID=2877989 RepID=A0AAE8Y1N8_9CAUD|nr:hypothetical protein M1M34_gp085 [Haloarcula tailed virus 2]UBF23248.1 hypothetical protein HATV-2_gp97 [Haloarcula tailed virus 2]